MILLITLFYRERIILVNMTATRIAVQMKLLKILKELVKVNS